MRNKLKITNEKRLTELEIEIHKDFDAVLKQHRAGTSRSDVNSKIWMVSLLVAVIGGLVVLINDPLDARLSPDLHDALSVDTLNYISLKSQEVRRTPDSIVADLGQLPEPKERQIVRSAKQTSSPATEKEEISAPPGETGDDFLPTVTTQDADSGNEIFLDAQPIEGFENLYQYFEANLSYPEAHRSERIEGVVMVSFAIMSDSTVRSVRVVESLGPAFDQEAVSLIEKMPKWAPASRNGIPHSTRLQIPITFRINDEILLHPDTSDN